MNGVAVTSNGRFAVSASEDKTVKVWNLRTGRAVRTIQAHKSGVRTVAVTPDGHFAVSASRTGWLRLWDLWDLKTDRAVRTIRAHKSEVRVVAVTPNARRAISVSESGWLKLWDLETGRALLKGRISVHGLSLTPDGEYAVCTSLPRQLRIWHLACGRSNAYLEAHTRLQSCAITPDGCTILAGDLSGALHILDWRNPPRLRSEE